MSKGGFHHYPGAWRVPPQLSQVCELLLCLCYLSIKLQSCLRVASIQVSLTYMWAQHSNTTGVNRSDQVNISLPAGNLEIVVTMTQSCALYRKWCFLGLAWTSVFLELSAHNPSLPVPRCVQMNMPACKASTRQSIVHIRSKASLIKSMQI